MAKKLMPLPLSQKYIMQEEPKKILCSLKEKNHMEVVDTGEIRSLFFKDSIVQSRININHPERLVLRYTQYMMGSSLLANEHPSHILLIGIGGGALLHFLNHHFPSTTIEAVDYSEQLLEVARKYFFLPENENISIHCTDGFQHLQNSAGHKKYDLILLDAFNDEGMARNIYSNEFFRLAVHNLSTTGIICCNLWSGNKEKFNRVKKGILKNCRGSIFFPVRQRENIVALLFQTSPPWKKLYPGKEILQTLAKKYEIDFTEIAKAMKKHGMKLSERIHHWTH